MTFFEKTELKKGKRNSRGERKRRSKREKLSPLQNSKRTPSPLLFFYFERSRRRGPREFDGLFLSYKEASFTPRTRNNGENKRDKKDAECFEY